MKNEICMALIVCKLSLVLLVQAQVSAYDEGINEQETQVNTATQSIILQLSPVDMAAFETAANELGITVQELLLNGGRLIACEHSDDALSTLLDMANEAMESSHRAVAEFLENTPQADLRMAEFDRAAAQDRAARDNPSKTVP